MAQKYLDDNIQPSSPPTFSDSDSDPDYEPDEDIDEFRQNAVAHVTATLDEIMPDKKKGTTRKGPKAYEEKKLQRALYLKETTQMSMRAICRETGVPLTTFRDHLQGRVKTSKRGRNPALNEDEIVAIRDTLGLMQRCHMPLTKEELQIRLGEWIRKHPEISQRFRDGVPG